MPRGFVAGIHVLAAVVATAGLARAQAPSQPAAQSTKSAGESVGLFLLGGGSALAAHEGGHLLFDGLLSAHPGLKKVSFHGLPFFAITHESGLSRRREFTIDSAGFWVQEATNEWLLGAHPNLRHERRPYVKGVFAFNVLASVAYAGAAFARTGPAERDTRGIAESLRWKEPVVGLLVLVPAVLDAVRYYQPNAQWARWGSRGAKITGAVLILK